MYGRCCKKDGFYVLIKDSIATLSTDISLLIVIMCCAAMEMLLAKTPCHLGMETILAVSPVNPIYPEPYVIRPVNFYTMPTMSLCHLFTYVMKSPQCKVAVECTINYDQMLKQATWPEKRSFFWTYLVLWVCLCGLAGGPVTEHTKLKH